MECSFEGCDKQATRKGMCNTHYHRMWANGTLETKTHISETGLCTEEGCNNKHYGKGLCKKHYYRKKKYPSKYKYIKREKTICIFEGCDEQAKTKGMCIKHYQAQYFQNVTKEKRKKKKDNV
jgi:hypothetical protein